MIGEKFNMEQMINSLCITGFTADGFKVSLTLGLDTTAETIAELMAKAVMAKKAGLLANVPWLKTGQEKEEIGVVVRRVASDGTPIVDFYPPWGYQNTFGMHKYAHMYLGTAEDVSQFEAQSGLKLADLPVYEGESAMTRKYGSPKKYEVKVKRPFEVVRTEDGTYSNGMPKYIYSYYAEINLELAGQNKTTPAPLETVSPMTSTAPAPDNKPALMPASLSSLDNKPASSAPPIPTDLIKADGALNVNAFWRMVHDRGMKPQEVLKRMGLGLITDKPAETVLKMWGDMMGASGGKPNESPLG
jgi:hypothetical protein